MQLIRICDILHYLRIEGRVLHLQAKRDTDIITMKSFIITINGSIDSCIK